MMIDKKVVSYADVTISLTGDDIMKALVDADMIDCMPSSYDCKFQVPGGGDYSNMSVNVDKDAMVIVEFREDSHE